MNLFARNESLSVSKALFIQHSKMMGLPSLFSSLWRGLGSNEADDGNVGVHPDTHDPTVAWEKLGVKQKVTKVKPLPLTTPINENKVRFVCVSDTHNRMPFRVEVPDGDVLLHAGDFSMIGRPQEIESFNDWLGTMPHKHKVVIAGNHDLSFDNEMLKNPGKLSRFGLSVDEVKTFIAEKGISHMKELLTNCTYLEDSETTVYGQRIYGSPWQPWFHDWGFNLERGQPCLDKWNLIPEGIDILMTHGPPIGHGDLCSSGHRAGCVELLQTIQKRLKCKYHVFGHIHEGYGVTTDGQTTYINPCTCTLNYRSCNNPVIFDIPLPEGTKKSDFETLPSVTPSAEVGQGEEEEDMEEEEEDGGAESGVVEEPPEDLPKGPLVLNQDYQLEPTLAPHSSTSIASSFGTGIFKS